MTDEQRARALPQPEDDEGLVKRLEMTSERDVAALPMTVRDDCHRAAQALTAKDARIAELKADLIQTIGIAAQEVTRAEARIAELEAERDWLRAENERLREALIGIAARSMGGWVKRQARAALTPATTGRPG